MNKKFIPNLKTSDKPRHSPPQPAAHGWPGVGPVKRKLLTGLGIHTMEDLLEYYPRDWQDRSLHRSIAQALPGGRVTVSGQIRVVDLVKIKGSFAALKAAVADKTGIIYAVWFKHLHPRYDVFASLKRQLQPGTTVNLYGEISYFGTAKEILVDEWEVMSDSHQEPLHTARIVPLYTLQNGLDNKFFRSLVHHVLTNSIASIPESLPSDILPCSQFLSKKEALSKIHFPNSLAEAHDARARLAFEEFLKWELGIHLTKQARQKESKTASYKVTKKLLTPFRQQLGFELTRAQKRVINEIFSDLQRPYPMNRLLQGDVGSGKTVVACAALLLAVENGLQGVFLAPTEILAEQHSTTLSHFLRNLPITCGLLTGRMPIAKRRTLLKELAEGKIDILLGTLAILEEDVSFAKLGLVVIDEQHRFGVHQRYCLQKKGHRPDVLVMTATPIPRSLALTVFGDLDISLLDELPSGRGAISTRQATPNQAYETVNKVVAEGRQAYIVYPLIEESDKLELKAVLQEAEYLKKHIFSSHRVEVLHGQMPPPVKDMIMRDFAQGNIDILVATTVIEVGIDVPNAAVMVIEHADRFGLATLHQLRGRVGRGSHESVCLLLGDDHSQGAQARLRAMLATNDGFRLSEEDFSLRGPGDIFGTLQHGIPPLKVGDLVRDAALVDLARQKAEHIISEDPELKHPRLQGLKEDLRKTFFGKWKWIHVG